MPWADNTHVLLYVTSREKRERGRKIVFWLQPGAFYLPWFPLILTAGPCLLWFALGHRSLNNNLPLQFKFESEWQWMECVKTRLPAQHINEAERLLERLLQCCDASCPRMALPSQMAPSHFLLLQWTAVYHTVNKYYNILLCFTCIKEDLMHIVITTSWNLNQTILEKWNQNIVSGVKHSWTICLFQW